MIELILTLLIVLQFLDIYTTINILKLGGKELNPFLVRLFKLIGPLPGLLLAKGVFIAFLLYLYISGFLVLKNIFVLTVLLVIYLYVVYNNFNVLKALKLRSIN